MTTLTFIDGLGRGETRAAAVARRLRSELAAKNIKAAAAARICGVTQPWMSRRLTGRTPFDINDLDLVCDLLGISYEYVASGIRPIPPPPPPDGSSLLPRMDSNHQPPDLKNKTSLKASTHVKPSKAA